MTSNSIIEINDHGLSKRMAQFPQEFDAIGRDTMEASLIIIHENIPPYPDVPNPVRDGTLGRTLGSSMQGGKVGKPDIYENKKLGSYFEGRFGTKKDYAEYVVGEKQSWFHYRWWLLKNIAKESEKRIVEKWNLAADKMARFLDGKGL